MANSMHSRLNRRINVRYMVTYTDRQSSIAPPPVAAARCSTCKRRYCDKDVICSYEEKTAIY